MSAHTRLSHAFKNAPVLPLNDSSRYILISDCHRGNGTSNDNFLKNQNLYFAALSYYFENGYTYIELGDGDELWENRSINQILDIHSNVFWLFSKFQSEGRLYQIFGNHDLCKKQARFYEKYCLSPSHEGIILKDEQHEKDLYLTHGHQADFLNSVLWKISRFLVRYVWRTLEHLGFLDPTSAAKNYTKKKKTEEILTDWAMKNNHILITGHTHRPMIGSQHSPYFNTGSCVHPRCITCIEVEHRCMALVKWTLSTREDMSLYVARKPLAGPICIDEY